MVSEADRTPRRRGRPPSGGREAILDAGLELVRSEGISRLTSRAVAARAGVSDASVYYHFGDRQSLLVAVFEHGIEPSDYLNAVPEGSNWQTVLSAAFHTLVAFFDDLLPIVSAAHADAELAEIITAYIAANDLGPHKGIGYLATYLRSEQAAGRVNPDADVEAVSMLLINAAVGASTRRTLMRPDDADARIPTPQRLLEALSRLLEPTSDTPAQNRPSRD